MRRPGLYEYITIMKGNVGVMILSWVLFGIGWAIVMPYFSLYIKLLGGGDFGVSLVRSLGVLGAALMTIPGGYLTDKLGRRRLIIPMTWIITLITFLYAIVPDWITLLILWFIDSTLHFYRPALMTIIVDSLPPHIRARGIALTMIAPNIPWLIMPPIGGYLYDLYGIQGIRLGFIIAGIVGLLAASLRTKYLKETYSEYQVTGKAKISLREILHSYIDVYRVVKEAHIGIRVLTLDLLLLSAWAIGFLEAYGVIYATEYLNITGKEWGVYTALASLSSMIVSIIVLPVLDSMPRKRLLSIGLLLKTIPYVLLLSLRIKEVMLPILILNTISSHTILPVARNSYIGDITPASIRGRVISFINTSAQIGYTWTLLILGYIYSIKALGPYMAITITLILSIIEIFYILLFLREEHR